MVSQSSQCQCRQIGCLAGWSAFGRSLCGALGLGRARIASLRNSKGNGNSSRSVAATCAPGGSSALSPGGSSSFSVWLSFWPWLPSKRQPTTESSLWHKRSHHPSLEDHPEVLRLLRGFAQWQRLPEPFEAELEAELPAAAAAAELPSSESPKVTSCPSESTSKSSPQSQSIEGQCCGISTVQGGLELAGGWIPSLRQQLPRGQGCSRRA